MDRGSGKRDSEKNSPKYSRNLARDALLNPISPKRALGVGSRTRRRSSKGGGGRGRGEGRGWGEGEEEAESCKRRDMPHDDDSAKITIHEAR